MGFGCGRLRAISDSIVTRGKLISLPSLRNSLWTVIGEITVLKLAAALGSLRPAPESSDYPYASKYEDNY